MLRGDGAEPAMTTTKNQPLAAPVRALPPGTNDAAARRDSQWVWTPRSFGCRGTSALNARRSFGRARIRAESALLRPYNMATGAAPFDALQVADLATCRINTYCIEQVDGDHPARSTDRCWRPAAAADAGGDHTIALPILRALARAMAVALVHVDAMRRQRRDVREAIAMARRFRRAVEEGLLACDKVYQIGLRGTGYDRPTTSTGRASRLHDRFRRTSLVPVAGAAMARVREAHRETPCYNQLRHRRPRPVVRGGTGTPEVVGLSVPRAGDHPGWPRG